MKRYNYIFFLMLLVSAAVSCVQEEDIKFALDSDTLTVKPEGGEFAVNLSVGEEWVAKTDSPWIAVSPANGRGGVECRIMIDSTLLSEVRKGEVMIQTASDTRKLQVIQEGFELRIEPKKPLVEISDFDVLSNRKFEVEVSANTDFDVQIPDGSDGKPWLYLKNKNFKLDLDRGMRPRTVRLQFEWKVNPERNVRNIDVAFVPKDAEMNLPDCGFTVKQGGAPDIESVKGTREGDSLALLSISRFLGCWSEFDTGQRLDRWEGITVHKSGTHKGRVKSASFVFFDTEEPLPYAVKYLTAAEELYFFSNVNSFQKSLDLGEDICELTELKRLTLFSYGLTTLPDKMEKMDSLRYLDLGGNNFSKIPRVLQKCKSLTALFLTTNQRSVVTDLSNTVKTDIGGLVEETPSDGSAMVLKTDCDRSFPLWLLNWNQLDTLRLSVNYLQGKLPTDEQLLASDEYDFRPWDITSFDEDVDEIHMADSLGDAGIKFFTENAIPMVLPNIDFFSINLNRLHGDIPYWLKYHPKLDLWTPLLLIFPQEGKDENGHPAGFNDVPTNLNYYYEIYAKKAWSSINVVN